MGLRTVAIAGTLIALATAIALQSDGDKVSLPSAVSPDQLEGAKAAPMRILPGSAASVDWLSALGIDPGRIVALPIQADRWSEIRLDPTPWADRPRYERLASEVALGFKPDLVLVSPFSSAAVVERIRSGGARVLNVLEPSDWEGLLEAGLGVAAAIQAQDSGAALVETLGSRKAALGARNARALRVLPYGNFGGGGTTSGTDTTLDLALELAGYINVAAANGISGNDDLSHEQILSMDFDAVLVLGEEDLKTSSSADALLGAAPLERVAAIQERRFLVLSEALYAAGSLAILDAAEELARQGDRLTFSAADSSD